MATAAASRPSGPVLSGGDVTNLPGKSASGLSPSPTRRHSCTCSSTKTNHPGSSGCSLHKVRKQAAPVGRSKPASPPSIRGQGSKRMNSRQCARRALKPSPAAQQSQHLRRAGGFLPRTSRLSAMSAFGERASDKQSMQNPINLVVEASVVFLVWLWRRCFIRGGW